MTAQLAPAIVFKDWTANGIPLAFGTVTTYAAGTQTLQATYVDSTQSTPNTNPILLNARGEANIWLNPQLTYKFLVQDSSGNIIRTVDQVAGPLASSNLGNLIPGASNTYTLGSAANPNLGTSNVSWANLYLGPNTAPVYDATSGNIGYWALNFNETASLVTDYGYAWGDVRRYGALSGGTPSYSAPLVAGPGGAGDCTVAVKNALTGMGFAMFPPGDWRLDTTINLNGTAILLQAGAVITRYSATSAATTPMFWAQGPNCAIIGQGIASQIVTQNAAPSGIVLNGCASMTSNSPLGLDVNYNTFQNFKMVGQQAYGQSAGPPDACYMQINPQLDGHTCYFAFLDKLVANASNFGYWLQGWGNGNQMSNLHGYWIGNTTRALATAQGADALFFSQGALDNNLSNMFHHFSPGIVTFRIEDYNNTGTSGGSDHVTSYCSYKGLICEQGGSSYSMIANGTCTAFSNYIEIIDNTSLGYSISATFLSTQANTLFTATNGLFAFRAQPTQLVSTLVAPAYGTTVAINAALGNVFQIVVTNGTGFTISAPTNTQTATGQCQRITIQINNQSGTTVGTITWAASYKLEGGTWTSPANTYNRSIIFDLYPNGGAYEVCRTAGDVAN